MNDCNSMKTLVCGHVYCKECLYRWCKTGCNENCPTCRRPIYFKGYRNLQSKWFEEKMEKEYSEHFSELIDNCFEYVKELKELPEDELSIEELYILDEIEMMEERGKCYVKQLMMEDEKVFNDWKDVVYPEDIFDCMENGVLEYEPRICRDPVKNSVPYYRPTHIMI
jgi:hypothetical protein